MRTALICSFLVALAPSAFAQPAVPSFRVVTGHSFGERITLHHQMQTYLERLAATSPRVRLIRQGESWERRALPLAVVTAPENHARLEAIRENSLRLADPRRTSPAEARAIIATQPVVVWYGGSIHGFELSGSEGALKLLEHLTTRNDVTTLDVLRHAVVLIDPMLNPDGRDAFANLNHENIGREPNPAPQDWNNDFTPWQSLKFRTGHYYFDTNRDWFAHTQRETRERMPTLHAWRPQIATDMHEMGAEAEFYFDPPGYPTNPHMPRFALRWFEEFGNAYAAAFDSAGFEYMTRERYNYFYPGYTSNRGYQGAVAMLFEQGSSRGLALERPDGTIRTLAQALEQQYLAAWTGLRVAAAQRERLLQEYYDSQREIVQPTTGPRRFFVPNDKSGNVRELIKLLRSNDVEVGVLTAAARDVPV
ncbi:MAG TPA: M14 family zinc carboxypeptidase, partial [Gemmatimonadaceae bacterium]|nr:M14 family zinc carboxypeptidase [Gemmatimonadaceae bacterium]